MDGLHRNRWSVSPEYAPLAHAIQWDALDAVKAGRSVAVVCFSNSAVSKVADLLGTPTERRRVPLVLGMVASKGLMAAQDELYLALVRHWLASSNETTKQVAEALALLTVGGKQDHPWYARRAQRLTKELDDGKLACLPVRTSSSTPPHSVADLVEKSLGPVAASLGAAVTDIWKSAAWGLAGLRRLAWTLSQGVPDGLDLAALGSLDRLARAWDQARRWRSTHPSPALVMTVNQSKNREFDDVFVYVDAFQNEIRGPITELNKMQMYVAVSRARRSVKLIWIQNKQTKLSVLLNTVIPQ